MTSTVALFKTRSGRDYYIKALFFAVAVTVITGIGAVIPANDNDTGVVGLTGQSHKASPVAEK